MDQFFFIPILLSDSIQKIFEIDYQTNIVAK